MSCQPFQNLMGGVVLQRYEETEYDWHAETFAIGHIIHHGSKTSKLKGYKKKNLWLPF